MKVLLGGQKKAFLIFFASHIPFTMFMDSQALLSAYFPQFFRDFTAWYCDLFGDVLMRFPSPPWFQALVMCEILVQLPFFFVACHMLTQDSQHADRYPRWFQTYCIIYGSHVSTTLIPILPTFWTSTSMTTAQIAMTTAVYLPYLLFPLALLYLAAVDDFAEVFKKPVKNKVT
jgi:EXPERA (EXPanded EBP superfamily)